MRLSFKTKQVLGVTSIVALAVVVLSAFYIVLLARDRLQVNETYSAVLAKAIYQRAFPVVRTGEDSRLSWSFQAFLTIACLRAAPVDARSVSLDSGPRTRPITIDGKLDDWQDALVYVKQGNLAIGLMNDGADLYLCLQSRDPAVNLQILDQGMTAWLSAPGADAKQFGIEYPLARDRVETYSRMTSAMTRLAIRGAAPDDRRILAIADATGILAVAAQVLR